MAESFYIRELGSGLMLLAQRMAQVSSAAMTLAAPAGCSHDPPESAGAGSVACEWCLRGAGDRDTRQLNDALDSLGCQHYQSVQSDHILLSSAQLGRNLHEAMAIFADIIRRPRLEDATFCPSRDLVRQDLASLEDEPARKVNLMLRERFYPAPLGRCAYGRPETLEAMTPEGLRRHLAGHISPRGMLLAVAGNVDFAALSDCVERCFGDWQGPPPRPVKTAPPAGGTMHIRKDSAQVHIALAHPAVPIRDGRYYAARMAEMVLSGGASARLHTEVREKRGLVYHVGTHYHSLKDHAGYFTYAGTRPELARQTFDVTVGEIRRLAEGIASEELHRARTQLKSSLIMQGESTAARANAMASDYYHLRRLRGLDEVAAAIQAVTVEDVLSYLHEYPAEEFTVLTIGPEPVDPAAAGVG